MHIKTKILIGILVIITLSSLVYSNFKASEAKKHQVAAVAAQKEAMQALELVQRTRAEAREAQKIAESMADKMYTVYREFEKCKSGEEFTDIERPSLN